jgi:non-specific serine/threonine protein kinase
MDEEVHPRSDVRAVPGIPLPLTRFLGRKRELADIERLLSRTRLLTLVGPGGAGKTRLAQEVAASVNVTFADGVRFVDLVPLRSAALVLPAIARAFGLVVGEHAGDATREGRASGTSALRTLTGLLHDKHVLVVLDNCEHVLEAVPALGELVRACPRVTLLATSRAALRLTGEHEYPVGALDLPPSASGATVGQLMACDAVRLFIERARAVAPHFAPTAEDAPILAEICRRLDGLPLAIELAAARLKVFPPPALLARLERRLPLLTDGPRDAHARHQTQRAALDWSYQLLTQDEQALLRRMGIFVGGGSLEAVAAVCADPEEPRGDTAADGCAEARRVVGGGAVDLLSSLRNASLVEVRSDLGHEGQPRVGLLETVREYALERLAASGESEALRQRHAAYYLALAGRPVPDDGGGNTEVFSWLDHLEAELGNFREAASWFLGRRDPVSALQLGLALHPLWEWRADPSEGRHWLERALAAAEAADSDSALRVLVLRALAVLAGRQTDHATSLAYNERAIALARTLGDRPMLAHVLMGAGQSLRSALVLDRAQACFEEARDLFTELGDAVQTAWSDCWLGTVARSAGEHARARSLLERGLDDARAMDQPPLVLLNFLEWNLGNVACDDGDYEQARAWHRSNVARTSSMRRASWYGASLLGTALWAARAGRPEEAVRLLAAATALRDAIHHPWPLVDRPDVEEVMARTNAALPPDAVRRLEAEGRSMAAEPALAHALATLDSPLPATATGVASPTATGCPGLTPRQWEVARLVARGLTNREIAAALTVTERTAENHVQHVMDRLGFRSRSQIAAWATTRSALRPPG